MPPGAVVIATSRKRCLEDTGFKLVLMSATIDAGSLAAYYNGFCRPRSCFCYDL